jgi:hypothetical protein
VAGLSNMIPHGEDLAGLVRASVPHQMEIIGRGVLVLGGMELRELEQACKDNVFLAAILHKYGTEAFAAAGVQENPPSAAAGQ